MATLGFTIFLLVLALLNLIKSKFIKAVSVIIMTVLLSNIFKRRRRRRRIFDSY